MGHMTQVAKGIQLTKPQQPNQHITPLLPNGQPLPNKLHIYTRAMNTLFTDNMGQFPIELRSRNSYIMLAHHVRANAIIIEPFKFKADTHQIPAHNAVMERMKAHGLSVNLQVLDNEASATYIDCITNKWKCKHQKVPPDIHQRNIAKHRSAPSKHTCSACSPELIHDSQEHVGISSSTKQKSHSTSSAHHKSIQPSPHGN
jgi:trans-aconitate methyltransferase